MNYKEILDSFADQLATVLGVPATRDMDSVFPLINQNTGVVFVGFPTHVQRLMGGANLEVPVSLITLAPSNLQSVDWLLDRMDSLVSAVGAKSVSSNGFVIGDVTLPAITAIAQIGVEVV